MTKSFFIETFGCQMNKCDSELMELSMHGNGFRLAKNPGDADILIYNTCSVRQHAEDRAISRIKSTGKKTGQNKKIIVVAGCMAQRIGESLLNKNIAHLVVGTYESPKMGDIVSKYLGDKINSYLSLEPDSFTERINSGLIKSSEGSHWHRWVTITHGCENFCSYCIVPYVRGKLISFSSTSIFEYIKLLIDEGISEITLLGQNVNQYGIDIDEMPFYSLLDKIAENEKLLKINFITSHPKDFSEDIIKVIGNHKNISRSIHLPIQSGSDRVLKLMNRKYTVKHYMDIIEKIDLALDSYSISTDLIVGFPGEENDDFSETLKTVEAIRFDDAFMYAYSPRSGTPAFKLEESLSRDEKIGRLNRLINLQRSISREKLKARIDHVEKTIIERISKRSSSEVMGRTFLNHPVIIPGSKKDIGKQIMIKINNVKGSTLQGTRIA
ncbi:tRNA (N6-isopentenyl adenosine(37)-C2)-methylthiotransferase MiaB [Spirochaetota bacterium]